MQNPLEATPPPPTHCSSCTAGAPGPCTCSWKPLERSTCCFFMPLEANEAWQEPSGRPCWLVHFEGAQGQDQEQEWGLLGARARRTGQTRALISASPCRLPTWWEPWSPAVSSAFLLCPWGGGDLDSSVLRLGIRVWLLDPPSHPASLGVRVMREHDGSWEAGGRAGPRKRGACLSVSVPWTSRALVTRFQEQAR